jgi:hypothetical protein
MYLENLNLLKQAITSIKVVIQFFKLVNYLVRFQVQFQEPSIQRS